MPATRTKPRPPAYRTFTMAQVEEASAGQCGLCLACGGTRDQCEPDARRYRCDACGLPEVYGAEELMLTGRVRA